MRKLCERTECRENRTQKPSPPSVRACLLVVGRGMWVVGRGSWVPSRGSWFPSRGSWVVGRGSQVVGRGLLIGRDLH